MKTDLISAIVAAIVGVVVTFLILSNVIPNPKPVSVKTISNPASANVNESNPEIFNYRALNPTVEAYVDCKSYNTDGSCIEE